MKRKLVVGILLSTLVAGPVWSANAHPQEMSSEGQRVVEYLLADWQRQFSSTTIPHAMEYLGLQPDDALRLEVIQHLRANDALARNLQWWGANNYLFTNLEKRIAKYLVYRAEHALPIGDITLAAAELGAEPAQIAAALAFMEQAGFLTSDAGSPIGFALASGYKRWAGPLQHNFHTVYIDGEQPLDVW